MHANTSSTQNLEKKNLGADWLARAQEHMLDANILQEGMMIGKIFNAAVKKLEWNGRCRRPNTFHSILRSYRYEQAWGRLQFARAFAQRARHHCIESNRLGIHASAR